MPDGPDGQQDHAPAGPDTGVSVTIDSDGHIKGIDANVGGHGPGHVDIGGGDKTPTHAPGWTPNLNPPDPVDLHDLRPLWIPPHTADTDDGSGTIPSGPYVTDPFSGQDYDPLAQPHVPTVPDPGDYPHNYPPDMAVPETDPGVEPPAPDEWQ